MRVFYRAHLSPLSALAGCSILALVAVTVFQIHGAFQAKNDATTYVARTVPTATSTDDGLSVQEKILLGLTPANAAVPNAHEDNIDMITPQVLAQIIGEYNGLQQSGTYSSSTASAAVALIAPNVQANVPAAQYDESMIRTDADSSYARMLTYRADMQTALKPLLKNTRAEYGIYGQYVATGDKAYLRELQTVAGNYSAAADAASKIVVPADILETHLDIVNALSHFSATLNALVAHADDPIASVAVLRTYNDTELAVVTSFDKLAHYERMKQP